jgi:hypothetical protein
MQSSVGDRWVFYAGPVLLARVGIGGRRPAINLGCTAQRRGVLSLSRPRRLHDICRTVAARSAELGIQPHVIEAVLNHASGHKAGVAGVYNRALYAAEKRKALELWSEHVRALAEGIEQGVILLQPRYPAA